jgi:hypothetical protein
LEQSQAWLEGWGSGVLSLRPMLATLISFLVVLGFELRALRLQSGTWATPPVLCISLLRILSIQKTWWKLER